LTFLPLVHTQQVTGFYEPLLWPGGAQCEPGPDSGVPLVQPGAGRGRGNPMATEQVEYHSVPEIVINRDGPEEQRIAFVDDFGGTMHQHEPTDLLR